MTDRRDLYETVHTELADDYSVKDEFNARIERVLSSAALYADQYQAPQRHYLRSMRQDATLDVVVRIAALLGDHHTCEPIVSLQGEITAYNRLGVA